MMIARIATLICFLGMYYLFRADREKSDSISNAVWIPLTWMFFSSSRFASQWLSLGAPENVVVDYSEGSPLDRNVFLFLILAGVNELRIRKLDWPELFRRNVWIWLFFLYALISIMWSDDIIVSFKRWIKGAGNLVMALVIMTEKKPYEALAIILRRLGYLLLPLSVLFIRYYPDLGRTYHMGVAMFTGACFQKNSLGQLVVIIGTYYCWEILVRKKSSVSVEGPRLSIILIMLPMVFWLLYMAHSATAIVCMGIALSLLMFSRLPMMIKKPEKIINYGLVILMLFGLFDTVFDIKNNVIRMLGREPDLTDRTPVWNMVVEMAENPLIGAGYEIFWSGDRLIEIWRRTGFASGGGIIQAHNGYIEIYLNLGIFGLILLIGSIICGLLNTQNLLKTEPAYAILQISIILIIVINNYTEATFKPVSYYFVLLLAACLKAPNRNNELRQSELDMIPLTNLKPSNHLNKKNVTYRFNRYRVNK